ncbi:hypothetical protein [Stenotrophomonas maltophilia]|uniref:hypothetical protein n=1 Tax=Stenotrophomonas maltophilia TaxID=40324 RepID=UPI0015DF58CC|nr:hypothetical protein [Stenotrophomonas maltophilia]
MKKEFRLLCALGMATMHTVAMANQSSYQDRQMASSDGRQWVERTVRLSDFEGGDVAVQVLLFKDGKGGSVYRYDDQNEATKLYHQAACEVMNSKARRGETVISGESAVVGWSCEGDSDPAEDSNPASSDMTQPKAGVLRLCIGAQWECANRSQLQFGGNCSFREFVGREIYRRCMTSASDEYAGPTNNGSINVY